MREMITVTKSQPMYVVNSLEEKQKVYGIVSVVEHLLTQVGQPTHGRRKTQNSVPLSWGCESQSFCFTRFSVNCDLMDDRFRKFSWRHKKLYRLSG